MWKNRDQELLLIVNWSYISFLNLSVQGKTPNLMKMSDQQILQMDQIQWEFLGKVIIQKTNKAQEEFLRNLS